ncbi:MAG: glycosyltransferase family 9 protein [Rubrivivax sp.]
MTASPARPGPLIVRLRNWVGDVTLGVPMLQRLHDAGYGLQLVGKRWASDLLAGQGWPVHVLPATLRERVALLRRLRADAVAADGGFDRRVNALCLPFSFSSALEFRLAGLRALGHAHEGRSPLLAQRVPRPASGHELAVYWGLGSALLQQSAPLPSAIGLRVAARHREAAAALRAQHGIAADAIHVCPFAGGTFAKLDKSWPEFAAFVSQRLPAYGRDIVVCPGPGEEAVAQQHFSSAKVLTGVGLGTYAALLADAAVMVANDTGPGHLAAAVGAPLVSVLGPTDAAQWGAWGATVRLVQGSDGWPDADAVASAVGRALSDRERSDRPA